MLQLMQSPTYCLFFIILNDLVLLFPSSWGESFLISLQDVALVLLFFYYSGKSALTFIFLPVYVAGAYVLCSGITPLYVLEKLQAFCVVIMASSKVSST